MARGGLHAAVRTYARFVGVCEEWLRLEQATLSRPRYLTSKAVCECCTRGGTIDVWLWTAITGVRLSSKSREPAGQQPWQTPLPTRPS